MVVGSKKISGSFIFSVCF